MIAIPQKMKALQIDAYHENLTEAIKSLYVVEKPTPKPSHGQVLVKMEAAPCNPSDLLLLQGHYGRTKTLPAVPGWEGAGTVVASGGGLMGSWLVGKRVACAVQSDSDGTWAQYCVVDVKTCIPLKEHVTTEQGSTLIINPLTALGMIDIAKKGGHAAIVQTAAASQVGRMVLQLAKNEGIPVIHIVRRNEQEELLRQLGAEIVLNSESANFREELKKEAMRLNATIAFDAVAGKMTGLIFSAMPPHSRILVYGALSDSFCSDISPLGLIFQMKKVEGFWLSSWLEKKNFFSAFKATNRVQKLMAEGTFHTAITASVSLEKAPEALEKYHHAMTSGKVIILPQGS